jgi:tetratricopeptide (TPR) repeat protein
MLDPEYALAWAGLGDAYVQRVVRFGFEISWLDSGVEVSKKAIALDGNSAEAYKALGNGYQTKGIYDKSLEAYLKAVQFNPNHFPAVGNLGQLYILLGRTDEALRWLKKAVVLGPTSPVNSVAINSAYQQLGDFVEAEHWLRKALELQPDLRSANESLTSLYVLQNKDQQANEQMKKVVASNPDNLNALDFAGVIAEQTGKISLAKEYYERSMKANPSFETDQLTRSGIGLGHILLKEGKQNVRGTPYGEARRLLNQARTLQRKQIKEGDASFEPPYYLAAISAIEGNTKEANAWLQTAIAAGYRDYYVAQRDPWLDNLRNDKQYKQIMAQLKAKLDAMRKKVEEME